MNHIPFLVAGLLLTCGLITTAIAVPLAIRDGQDTSNGDGYGFQPLEVEIIENYGPYWVVHTPGSIQFQSYVDNGDGELIYSWHTDEGMVFSTEANPTITITSELPGGYFTIYLTVTDEDGDTGLDSFTFEIGAPSSMIQTITVDIGNEFPDEDETNVDLGMQSNVFLFAFPRIEGPPPVEVYFTTTGIFCIGYIWDFGDGSNVSSGSSTSHIYQSSGHFNITLYAIFPGPDENDPDIVEIGTTDVIIYDEDPSDEVSVDMDIPDFPEDAPRYVMDLTILADPVQGMAPLYVNFNTNIAPAVTTGFLWNFGDGGPVSFERGASHIFIEPGIYHVTLAYSSGYGGYGYGEIDIIVEDPNDEIFNVEIEVIPTDIERTFQLIAHPSIEAELTYDWTFTHEESESGWRTLHQFNTYGMNQVEVIVYNEDLDLYATARVEIFIPQAGAPSVHFLIHPAMGDPALFQFEPIVGGGVPSYSYIWHFGDGASSSEENPTHHYNDDGYYKVELFMEDGEGRVGYYSDYLFAYSSTEGEF